MRLKTAAKIGIIIVLSLLMFIPLGMIQGLIGERQALRDGVIREIARESVDMQQVTGPIIIVPYKQRVVDLVTEEKDGKTTTTRRERTLDGRLALMPERLRIDGALVPEERHRGIYKAILYDATLAVDGRFVIPRHFGIDPAQVGDYDFGPAMLVFGISDPRGISGGLTLDWDGTAIEFAPGADAPGLRGGVSVALGRLDQAGGSYEFRFPVQLKGLSRIDFVPTGKDSVVGLKAPWPHPSFYGRYLPQREIDEHGFTAQWRTSLLSTNVKQVYDRCLATRECELSRLAHGVALYQPVDIYQQLERSAKYGFLFVGLTFIAFFLHEMLKRLPIHPVQYALVGAALAVFYLLLTSLSERIGFTLAYAAASSACVALIGFYVCHVLRSVMRGAAFTALLAGLYGMLFVLVRAEDNALLMGSIALFAMLAIVMIGTRKVNWYEVEGLPQLRPGAPPPAAAGTNG
jgi:inner membrane protein